MLKLVLNCRLGERGMHVEELERELKLLLDMIKSVLLFLYCLAMGMISICLWFKLKFVHNSRLSVKALEDEGMVFSILPQIMLWSALSIMLWSDLGGSGSTCNSRTKTWHKYFESYHPKTNNLQLFDIFSKVLLFFIYFEFLYMIQWL